MANVEKQNPPVNLIIIRAWLKHNPGIFSGTFLLLVNGIKNSFLLVFQKHELSAFLIM